MYRLIAFFILIILLLSCNNQPKNITGEIYGFDLQAIAQKNEATCQIEENGKFQQRVLTYKPGQEHSSLTISEDMPKGSWGKAKYLICEVYHNNPYSALLNFEFYHQGGKEKGVEVSPDSIRITGTDDPRITVLIGVLPYMRSKVVLPLSFLDGQKIFLPRFPGQQKGYVSGHRIATDDIGSVKLRLGPLESPGFQTTIDIFSISLSNELPESYAEIDKPIVDRFGQWTHKDWTGKISTEAELTERMRKLERDVSNSSYPGNWSKYGGWKEKKFGATGFFRTQFDGKRWWLVDPEGYAFLSNGIDCINTKIETLVFRGKNENFFEWLPDSTNISAFRDALVQNESGYIFDFYKANLIRTYGKEWRKKWEEITSGLLKNWRINTIANWSDIGFAQRAKIPYVLPMSGFPGTKISLFRDFPDVFSKEYRENASNFAQQLTVYKSDPYLIGYFLSNEPQWAFGDFNLAFEMFADATASVTKKEFISWIRTRYNNQLASLDKAWGLKISSFEELENIILKEKMLTPASREDLKDFSGIMVDRYIRTVCEEVKKVDPHHLNLGMRYPVESLSSELLFRAASFFDAFSINGYSSPEPPLTDEIYKKSGKPVLIGEFHFGSLDRGLPATGLRGVASQAERGNAIRYYTEHGFTRPEIIGIHYFQWLDQSVTGRSDGENYNIGLLDVCNQPYSEVVNAIKITNERLYEVAAGLSQPYNTIAERIPTVCY